LAHGLLAFRSLQKGLSKLLLNSEAINKDLEANWAVVAEAIQTILRREGYPNPYEKLKELTRTHQQPNQQAIHLFIDNLDISEALREELKGITPWNYLGIKDLRQ
ncbi:MAG: adenylosuccinate lyase, partial [Bacteroidales bacterium]|nr:adenylosuccinate lyase [Bacteroidales bacterium]